MGDAALVGRRDQRKRLGQVRGLAEIGGDLGDAASAPVRPAIEDGVSAAGSAAEPKAVPAPPTAPVSTSASAAATAMRREPAATGLVL